MMVYGGIFPPSPMAEHGKTWLRPWDFAVVRETPDEVTGLDVVRTICVFGGAGTVQARLDGIEAGLPLSR